jgi:hypothetical protein
MIRMQYLVSVIDDGLEADGHRAFVGGLGAPSTAAVIDGRPFL